MTDVDALIDLHHIEEVAASHPLLRGLLRELPPAHSIWSKEQQRDWLELAASVLAVVYEESDNAATAASEDKTCHERANPS